MVIHYTDDDAEGHSSDLLPYVGEQTLLDNLWGVLGGRNLQAQVYFLDPVETAGIPRKALATGIQQKMQDCLTQSHSQFLAAKPLIHK